MGRIRELLEEKDERGMKNEIMEEFFLEERRGKIGMIPMNPTERQTTLIENTPSSNKLSAFEIHER